MFFCSTCYCECWDHSAQCCSSPEQAAWSRSPSESWLQKWQHCYKLFIVHWKLGSKYPPGIKLPPPPPSSGLVKYDKVMRLCWSRGWRCVALSTVSCQGNMLLAAHIAVTCQLSHTISQNLPITHFFAQHTAAIPLGWHCNATYLCYLREPAPPERVRGWPGRGSAPAWGRGRGTRPSPCCCGWPPCLPRPRSRRSCPWSP